MEPTLLALTALGTASAVSVPYLSARLKLSRAKHRSLAGHPRMARRIAALLPGASYDEARFFTVDQPPPEVEARRRAAFARLSALYAERFSRSRAATEEVKCGLSDLQFTSTYRVPYPFSALVRQHLSAGVFLQATEGVTLTDLDGNRFYDLTGSYGVNLFGVDFYKACVDEGIANTRALGPVLGFYHPLVAENVRRLRGLSGMDEVSFHMSGTEAVMQAVRLARYHTGKTHLVRFCGAYHGWWGEVQPGVGNPMTERSTYTLKDLDQRALDVVARRSDIACVLVNPLQALHPNQAAPSDSSLIDSSRAAGFDRERYTRWLQDLRAVCTRRGIALILDEVFLGFRLAPGGAQEYFGIAADLVTYGKTLGGGLPVGVLCGKRAWMARYRAARPADICFARGTFNSHPYVMGAMDAFLRHLETPGIRNQYADLDRRWDARAAALNEALLEAEVPVRVANLSSVWTVLYTQPASYNWMLQYYLRAEGLALSWVGSGRLIFSFNYSDADFHAVLERFVRAGKAMAADGWWWSPPGVDNSALRRQRLWEAVLAFRR
jgi:glutamate-1-semialdehyde 2,1-aminomutase